MPIAAGLQVQDTSGLRSTLKTKAVIKSTDKSYAKINAKSESIDKEDGDIDGPLDLVIQASDTYKDATSKVVIFASPFLLPDDWVNNYNCANIDLFIGSLDWMGDTQSIAIPQRSLDQVYLTVPKKDANVWAIITIVLIPLIILSAGFAVWFVRRKH